MNHLASAIHPNLPQLSFTARALIDALLLSGGRLGSAQRVATNLALPSRFSFARFLSREGLPPLHRLSGWITVLEWLSDWERNGTSLSRAALRAGKEPAGCYRLVKRITGLSWKRLRTTGLPWALDRFIEECSARTRQQIDQEPRRALPASCPPSLRRGPWRRNCTPCA